MIPVPVVDLFAGPGGLGEGFSAFRGKGRRPFRVVLSIEKDPEAHRTLTLRAFYRQFRDGAPDEYYACLAGELGIDQLLELSAYRAQAARARAEARLAELGDEEKYPAATIDRWIAAARRAAGGSRTPWVLIGGPPCQAYSLVGRSRMMGDDPRRYSRDPRHLLYRQYLRILAQHQPDVFVMENVKGLLSARLNGSSMFEKILGDLRNPERAIQESNLRVTRRKVRSYSIYPCVAEPGESSGLFTDDLRDRSDPSDFVVRCEKYGIPQARHRVILIGARSDYESRPEPLERSGATLNIDDVIADLPRVRSEVSASAEHGVSWKEAIAGIDSPSILKDVDSSLRDFIRSRLRKLNDRISTGGDHMPGYSPPGREPEACDRPWYGDDRLSAFCNHSTRTHRDDDLRRYFYAACFAAVHRRSPRLSDFPEQLLPAHENVRVPPDEGTPFDDRFRVQVKGHPATTVTSHISKDGHYFIHYDPLQCRSLTVREAARLQTFPDNYYFAGPRTSQYQQVGNAVPPLLALRLAERVAALIAR